MVFFWGVVKLFPEQVVSKNEMGWADKVGSEAVIFEPGVFEGKQKKGYRVQRQFPSPDTIDHRSDQRADSVLRFIMATMKKEMPASEINVLAV